MLVYSYSIASSTRWRDGTSFFGGGGWRLCVELHRRALSGSGDAGGARGRGRARLVGESGDGACGRTCSSASSGSSPLRLARLVALLLLVSARLLFVHEFIAALNGEHGFSRVRMSSRVRHC